MNEVWTILGQVISIDRFHIRQISLKRKFIRPLKYVEKNEIQDGAGTVQVRNDQYYRVSAPPSTNDVYMSPDMPDPETESCS